MASKIIVENISTVSETNVLKVSAGTTLDLSGSNEDFVLPNGETDQRPEYHVEGALRFNNEIDNIEYYSADNQEWYSPSVEYNITKSGLLAHYDPSLAAEDVHLGLLRDLHQGKHIVLKNDPVYSTDGGGSILFNGSNQYGVCRPFRHNSGRRKTICCWAKITGSSSGNLAGLTARANNYKWQSFVLHPTDGITSQMMDNSFYNERTTYDNGGYTIQNVWRFYCTVVDIDAVAGQRIKHYIDGESIDVNFLNDSGNSFYDGTDLELNIAGFHYGQGGGVDGGYNGFLQGNLGPILMYDRALTHQEIFKTYYAYAERFGKTISEPAQVTTNRVLALDATDPNSYPGTGSTWTDLSGSGNNATLYGSPEFITNWQASGAFYCPGNNTIAVGEQGKSRSYAVVTKNSTFDSSNHTASAWIYLTRRDDVSTFFSNHIQGSTGVGAISGFILSTYQNQFMYQLRINNVCCQTIQGYALEPGGWTHVCGTYDGSTMRLYVNGREIKTGSHSGTHYMISDIYLGANSDDYNLGNGQSSPYHLRGMMAWFDYYTRTLSASEVRQNYEATRGKFWRDHSSWQVS